MKKLIQSFAVLAISAMAIHMVAASSAVASEDPSVTALRSNPEFYKLSPAVVREVVPTAAEIYGDYLPFPEPSPAPGTDSLGIPGLDWGQLVTIGEKVIEIIKAGKPVVNVKRDAVAVVPMGVTAWSQLAGWQAPKTKVYQITAQNGFGINVVDMRLKVSMNYAGNIDGRGKFLANVIVVPSSISVMWGFSCDVWTEHQDPVNIGSLENPVAGLGFDIRYRYGSPFQEDVGTQDYFVSGSGEIREMQ